MADQEANVDSITRITVVDYRNDAEPMGRVFEAWDIKLDISIQDGGRTLKLFVWDKEAKLFYDKDGNLRAAVKEVEDGGESA